MAEFHCSISEITFSDDGKQDDASYVPIIQPIKTLHEALCWTPHKESCINVAREALRTSTQSKNEPRTLLCHDMKGGYVEDQFSQGFKSSTCYNFKHWNYIDLFVYFSHHFLTIPPPCWTNTAHRHGVKCLGTLITEWGDGASICKTFLENRASYLRLVDQMVTLASFYNFDGWLINIENKVNVNQIPYLIDFVGELSKRMKVVKQHSEVIWYDSVTIKGDLKWQDELNEKNKAFFDVCDGIFLNYTWKEGNLMTSVAASNGRSSSVYVGVDVFGRGCYGGGGYNTNMAVMKARSHQLSVAIFAPGWVHECHPVENFDNNQNKFWTLLLPYLFCHQMNSLPIVSYWCQGQGKRFFIDGVLCCSAEWTNISCQSLQTSLLKSTCADPSEPTSTLHIDYVTDIGYNGSGCYNLWGKFSPEESKKVYNSELISCFVKVDSPLYISFTTHLECNEDYLTFFFVLQFAESPFIVLLAPVSEEKLCFLKNNIENTVNALYKDDNSRGNDEKSSCLVLPKAERKSTERSPLLSRSDKVWNTHEFVLSQTDFSDKTLENVSICIQTKAMETGLDTAFSLYLGEMKIMRDVDNDVSFPSISKFQCENVIVSHGGKTVNANKVSFTLKWDVEGADDVINYYDLFFSNQTVGGKEATFLGRSYANAFRISGLEVESYELTVLLQPVSYGLIRQKVADCPKVHISLIL